MASRSAAGVHLGKGCCAHHPSDLSPCLHDRRACRLRTAPAQAAAGDLPPNGTKVPDPVGGGPDKCVVAGEEIDEDEVEHMANSMAKCDLSAAGQQYQATPSGLNSVGMKVGNLPPGGKADLKTLAAMAQVTRTGFYPKRHRDGAPRPGPYQHLAEEFERRLQELRAAGEIVNPRDAQVDRLKKQVDELKTRITAAMSNWPS